MADDLSAYIGYRSAGRRRPELNDRRAAADVPVALARGAVSGVLGAPGDIESLIRMLPGLSEQTVLPTSEDVEKRLPMRSVSETPAGRAFTTAGQLGGGFYTGPGSPLRAIAGLPSAVSRAAQDFALAAGQSGAHVVKPKGGNWLAGSVERTIDPMKTRVVGRDPAAQLRDLDASYAQNLEAGTAMNEGAFARERARLEPDIAINRWLETKLGKYMRNEMATPEDPIRALAERGILHYDPGVTGYNLTKPRAKAGFPEEGLGVSDLAKKWEGRSDSEMSNILQASDITSGYPGLVEENPWLLKVPPETRVYDILRGSDRDLGFSHLVDELKNAINPASGLPENLRWKYSDLDKVTVPQAVERVAKINDWRAAQKAEADMARAMNPATQVVKEYPEQGFKWVELRQPKDLPEGWTEKNGAYYDPQGERHVHPGTESLADALKYEGETMGHCVGGYCPDVSEGRSRIYSLRDKKGQPHVTIEVRPDIRPRESYYGEPQDEIVQIKGKGNKAPKEDYLPAVQDFVRSQNWGRVGDVENTGLVDIQNPHGLLRALNKASSERLISKAVENFNAAVEANPNAQRYMTIDELRDFLGSASKPEGLAIGGAVRGYAGGGLVSQPMSQPVNQANLYNSDAKQDPASAYKFADGGFAGSVPAYASGGVVTGAKFPTDNFDPARIDAIVDDLHAMNAA